MAIHNFRDLRVWQASMDLVVRVYKLSEAFPSHEMYGLSHQLRRAAVSVPSNIAEGHARSQTKTYLNHLSIAKASLAELETQLEIAARLSYLSNEVLAGALRESSIIGKQPRSLQSSLTRRQPAHPNPKS